MSTIGLSDFYKIVPTLIVIIIIIIIIITHDNLYGAVIMTQFISRVQPDDYTI